jgi:hypothetical protein
MPIDMADYFFCNLCAPRDASATTHRKTLQCAMSATVSQVDLRNNA